MIDPTLLAEIREAVEKASPGPWRLASFGDDVVVSDQGCVVPALDDLDDVRFIALARTAVPALLSELDRLRAEAAEMWDRFHGYECGCTRIYEHLPEQQHRNPYRSET